MVSNFRMRGSYWCLRNQKSVSSEKTTVVTSVAYAISYAEYKVGQKSRLYRGVNNTNKTHRDVLYSNEIPLQRVPICDPASARSASIEKLD